MNGSACRVMTLAGARAQAGGGQGAHLSRTRIHFPIFFCGKIHLRSEANIPSSVKPSWILPGQEDSPLAQ